MTRCVPVLLASVVAVAVGGCAPAASPDARFVDVVASTGSGVESSVPPAVLRQAGRAACAAGIRPDGGFDHDAAWRAANRALGWSGRDGRGYPVAEAARGVYCPP